jgi:hypothetical protein
MSLGIVIKAPEGLVLATESRLTITAQPPDGTPMHVNFDNATKLFAFDNPSRPNTTLPTIGVVTYGQAAIGLRTAQSFIPEFEAGLPEERLAVREFAQRLSDFFMQQWQAAMPATYNGPGMSFVIAGFDAGEPYGRVYLTEIPGKPDPIEHYGTFGEFGITWGGQREIVDRLLQGVDSRLGEALNAATLQPADRQKLQSVINQIKMPIPLQAMPLQDCVDLAIFFIRTTISAQRLTLGLRGVGGPIDVATITRQEGLRFIQRKQIQGEAKP